jgi:hypothetical protein
MTLQEVQQTIEAMLQVQRNLQERQLQFFEAQIRQSNEIEALKDNSERQQRNIERLIQLAASQQVDVIRTEDLLDQLEQRVRKLEDP